MSIDIVVVLPAPLCPSRAVICPLYMSRLKLSTALLRTPSFSCRFFLPENRRLKIDYMNITKEYTQCNMTYIHFTYMYIQVYNEGVHTM